MSKKVKAFSLFAGIGGFEVGMAKCGFTFTKALEWDANCCVTLNKNRLFIGSLEDEIKPLDITKVSPCSFSSEKVDYIVGGPPCQSFSAAGRRTGGVAGTSDTRGTLFWFYCQYVKHYQPKAFVFENVRGILSSKKGEDFKIICASFEEVGYKLFWRVLNAADYGVPQQRERLFLVGIRNDLNIDFHFPRPTHGPDSLDKRRYVTVREALSDVTDENEIVQPYGGKYGDLIPSIPLGENYRFYTEEMGHSQPLFAWRSRFSNFLYKVNPDDISRTIVAGQGKYDGPFHWHNRKCTVAEFQRLQGFPHSYEFPHNYAESVKQIGNSVCPPVAYQIGMALRYQVEGLVEYEIPLLNSSEGLSFDKRKGIRAKQSRAKKKTTYHDLQQISFNNIVQSGISELSDFTRNSKKDEYQALWRYLSNEKILYIDIISTLLNGSNTTTKIHLQFFGAITSTISKIVAVSQVPHGHDPLINVLWSEIHKAVSELSSYESLLPLFGHFTEPYPKFSINFSSDATSSLIEFQRHAISDEARKEIFMFTSFPQIYGSNIEDYINTMRMYGYDIRTSQTNRTIPIGHYRICYPFTLPQKV